MDRRAFAAVAAAFFASGAAALVYQVAWQRILSFETGVGVYSIALIVAAFMAGLGVGSEARRPPEPAPRPAPRASGVRRGGDRHRRLRPRQRHLLLRLDVRPLRRAAAAAIPRRDRFHLPGRPRGRHGALAAAARPRVRRRRRGRGAAHRPAVRRQPAWARRSGRWPRRGSSCAGSASRARCGWRRWPTWPPARWRCPPARWRTSATPRRSRWRRPRAGRSRWECGSPCTRSPASAPSASRSCGSGSST